MLINPIEAALNELHQALREAADHYENAARLLETDRAAAVLRFLGRERRSMAIALAEHIRTIGLPKSPDPDKELVEQIITRAKAIFSTDELAAIVGERQKSEQELIKKMTAAVQEHLPPETHALVLEMSTQVLRDQDKLRELTMPSS